MTSGIRHKYKYQIVIDKINKILFIVNNEWCEVDELFFVTLSGSCKKYLFLINLIENYQKNK